MTRTMLFARLIGPHAPVRLILLFSIISQHAVLPFRLTSMIVFLTAVQLAFCMVSTPAATCEQLYDACAHARDDNFASITSPALQHPAKQVSSLTAMARPPRFMLSLYQRLSNFR